jgi:hypothetical protein
LKIFFGHDLNAILNQNIGGLILNQIFFWQQYFVYNVICACKSVVPISSFLLPETSERSLFQLDSWRGQIM